MLKINFTLKTIIWKSINRNRIDGPKLNLQTNNSFLLLIFTACTKPPYNWKSFNLNGMLSLDIGQIWTLVRNRLYLHLVTRWSNELEISKITKLINATYCIFLIASKFMCLWNVIYYDYTCESSYIIYTFFMKENCMYLIVGEKVY